MNVYEELLESGKVKINEYLENTPTNETQFKYSAFNEECINEMYWKNDPSCVKPIEEIKNNVQALKKTCSECRNYHLGQRTNSVKMDDIKVGVLLEDVVIKFLNDKYKLNAVHGDDINKRYPDCSILDDNGKVLAYFEVKYHAAPFVMAYKNIGRHCYDSASLDLDKVTKQLRLMAVQSDAPVLYLHWIDYPCIKGIFFETSDQVKDELVEQGVAFERKSRSGDFSTSGFEQRQVGYTKKFYSQLLGMGTFEELIKTFQKLSAKAA